MDLRVKKTRRALFDALDSLLDEKPYEDITVIQICERAQVRRATFYDHFGSKEELLTLVVREKIETFKTQIDNQFTGTDSSPSSFYQYVIRRTMMVLDENMPHIRRAMTSDAFSLLVFIWQEETTRDIREHLEQDQRDGLELPLPPDQLANLFCGLILGLFSWRTQQGDSVDCDELVDYTCKLLSDF